MRYVRSRGVTLVELVVALALLGIVLSVSGLGLASLREPLESAASAERRQARAAAIRFGAPVRADNVLFLPDGRAFGPQVDPLTGEFCAR